MISDRIVKFLCSSGAILLLFLTLMCASQIAKLNTQYSIRQFFPRNHPTVQVDAEVSNAFQLASKPVLYAVLNLREGTPGTWTNPENLEVLRKTTDQLRASFEIKNILSLTNIEIATQENGAFRVGAPFAPLSKASKDISEAKQILDAQPLLRTQFLSGDQRSTLIAIEATESSNESLMKLQKEVGLVLNQFHDRIEGSVGGVPVVQTRISEVVSNEVSRFMILCFAVFVAMFILFYRNLAPILFVACGLIINNVVVIGVLSSSAISFTVLLSTLPVIVSITFVSLSVHTLHFWSQRLTTYPMSVGLNTRFQLSMRTLRQIFLPNLLGSTTTAIGFAMLVTTSIPAIRKYAEVVSVSVMLTFLVTQALLLVSLPWIRPVAREWVSRRAWWMLFVTRRAIPLLVLMTVFCVLMTGAASKLSFSAKLFDDLPKGDPVRETMLQMDHKFGGTVNLDVVVDMKKSDAWTSPDTLKHLQQAVEEIRHVANVGSVIAVTDFLGQNIPSTRGAVAESYFLFSMSPQNPLKSFVDNNARSTRLALRIADLSSEKVDLIRESVRAILKYRLPGSAVKESGLAVMGHTVNREVARELVYGFWQSIALIGLLLMIVFRSVRWAIVACIPNLIPPAILVGTLALFQTPVKPVIGMIFSIALGLAFNNTVYLLSRMRGLLDKSGMRQLALRRTLLDEGNPCLSESVLMFAGFMIFLASNFSLNQTLGVYMILSIFSGALADLIFLPAFLKVFPRIVSIDTKTRWSVMTAGFVAFIYLMSPGTAQGAVNANAVNEADQLLAKARLQLESKSDEARVTLTITEANGDAKVRELKMKTLREVGVYHALVRIVSPADIRNTGMLAEIKDGVQNQWIFLPSNHEVRRVISDKKSAGVLGSEISPDDLDADALKGASASLVKKDADHAWINIVPKAGTSDYTNVNLQLSLKNGLPEKMDYLVGSKTKKTVEFRNYVRVSDKTERAQEIFVNNLENQRSTKVEFHDLKVNNGSTGSDFTVSSLKRVD